MKLTLKRIACKSTYTIGRLYVEDEYFCDTLEPTVRDLNKNGKFDNGEVKIKGKTAIPYGTYELVWAYSPRFKKYTPRFLNVPEFEGVLIHEGNSSKDSAGCVLVGINRQVGKVLDSRKTVAKLYPIIRNACKEGKVYITIV